MSQPYSEANNETSMYFIKIFPTILLLLILTFSPMSHSPPFLFHLLHEYIN